MERTGRTPNMLPKAAGITFQPGDIVIFTDTRGRVLFWNEVAVEVLGFSPNEVLGLPLDVVCARIDGVRHNLDSILAGADFAQGFETRRKDGTLVALYMFCTRGEWEGISGVVCVGRDVSSFWRAEATVRAAEEKFRLLFNRSSDIVFIAREDGRIIEANAAFRQLSGYSDEELARMSIRELVRPDARAELEAALVELLRSGTSTRILNWIADRGARTVTLEFSANILKIGSEQQIFVIARDVTEWLAADQAVKESEEKYQRIFEAANDAIFLETLDGRILDVNENACRLLGYSRAELLALSVADLVPAEVLTWFPKLRDSLLQRGTFRAETVNLRKDGTVVPVEATFSLVELPEGNVVLAIIRDITERKQAEQALRESEEKYRNLVERANDGIAIIQDEVLKYVNPRLAQMWGGTAAEMVGTKFTNYVAPEELSLLTERYRRRMAGEPVPDMYETILCRRDGTRIEVELNAGTIIYQSRLANMVIVRDITERKQAQAALEESEANFRALAQNANDGILLAAADGHYLFANKRAAEITGYSTDELLNMTIFQLIHPSEMAKATERHQKRVRGEDIPRQYDTVFVRKDGKAIPVEVTGARTFWLGRPANLTVIRDISQRKAAEQALRESEAQFRSLIQLSPDGIAIHQDGKIVMVNPAGAKILGYDDPAELVGKPVMELVHPDDRELALRRIRDSLEQGKTGELVEERFRTRDGSYVWVEVKNGPFTWNNRPAVQVVIRDITERKRLLERLAEAAAQTKAIIDNSPHAVGAECEGRVAYANRVFTDLFGYSPEEVIGMPVEQLIAPQDRERLAQYTRDRLAGRPAPRWYTFQGLHRDGNPIDLEIYVSEYTLGEKKYTVGFLRKTGKENPEFRY